MGVTPQHGVCLIEPPKRVLGAEDEWPDGPEGVFPVVLSHLVCGRHPGFAFKSAGFRRSSDAGDNQLNLEGTTS
jgi:hypothetical protein